MSDEELREGAGGWDIPKRADFDGLYDDLVDGCFMFTPLDGADVLLDGTENGRLDRIAARNGFGIDGVEPIDGPYNCCVRVRTKGEVRNVADSIENSERVDGDSDAK